MRTLTTWGLAIAAVAATFATITPVHAQEYPWCAQYGDRGGGNCGFVSYRQCLAALSGNGGMCTRNPFFRGPYDGRRMRPDEGFNSLLVSRRLTLHARDAG